MTPREEDRELFYVDLTDICWVCATYCMRRVGFRGSINEFLRIKPDAFDEWDLAIGDILVWKLDSKNIKPTAFDEWDLAIGDSLVWKRDSEGELLPIEISGTHIITSYPALNRHFGVFEGDGLISDTALVGDMRFPHIRFRRLINITRSPDGVIRLPNKEIIHDATSITPQRGE